MPPYDKPRIQVNDLQGNQLTPAATPSVDSYNRPGYTEIDRFHGKTPFEKLADSLAGFDPTMQQFTKQQSAKYITDEEAKGAQQAFDLGREKVNAMIRAGEIPVGASPYAGRGFQRAALKQLGDIYRSEAMQAFEGPDGDEARSQNNPAAMSKFIDSQYQKFQHENLGNGYFSSLDLQEVFHPAIETANSQLMKAHADYRVKKVEDDYRDLVSVQASDILDQELGSLTHETPQADRDAAMQRAKDRMQDLRDNPDTGFGVSTGLMKVGSELLVDAAILKAMKTGDRGYLEVLDHLTTDQGAPLNKTQHVQAKILQAEEHITRLSMQELSHQWALEDRPYTVQAHEHQQQEWQRADERYEREKSEWSTHKAEKEIDRSLTRRVYEGLRMADSKRGVATINQALRDAEQYLPEKAEGLREIVGAFTRRQADFAEDSYAVVQMRNRILTDPLSVKPSELVAMIKNHQAKQATVLGLQDDLDKAQHNAGHPFQQQEQFKDMIKQVRQGLMNSPDDEFSAEAQVRISRGLGEFRDRADEWLQANPKANVHQFNNVMRKLVPEVLERHNADYGDVMAKERAKARGKVSQQEATGAARDLARLADDMKRNEELKRLKALESQPRMGRSSGFEPLTAKDFGRMSTPSQREALLNAKDDDARRKLLAEQFEPQFKVRGQSLEDMNKQIDVFLYLFNESKKPKVAIPTQATAKK